VTLASLTCSGAEVSAGLFLDMDPREGAAKCPGGKVRAQLDQLSDLICRGARSQAASYTLPMYTHGKTQILGATHRQVLVPAAIAQARNRCGPHVDRRQRRGLRRARGLRLDRGYRDLAPVAALGGSSMRFGPQLARGLSRRPRTSA